MKFCRYKNPLHCTSTEETRYAAQHVGVLTTNDSPKCYIAATDGCMAVAIAAQREDADSIPLVDSPASTVVVHKDAIKTALKSVPKGRSEATLAVTADEAIVTAEGGARMRWPTPQMRFPDLMAVVRDVRSMPVMHKVSLNVDLLAQLAKALGTEHVELTFARKADENDPEPPIQVNGVYIESKAIADGSFGLLMPLSGG